MTDKGPSEADIILNRANVALARSQRLIQSWLPAKTVAEESSEKQNQVSEEEDFDGLDELSGIGAKRKANDEGSALSALKRHKSAANDKLLEQLLGKKAAQERRRQQQAQQSAKVGEKAGGLLGWSQAQGAKAKASVARQQPESDDEEEGRSTAFTKRRKEPAPARKEVAETEVANGEDMTVSNDAFARPITKRDDNNSDDEDGRPAKRKAGSYLDEILSQKSKKNRKKKKKAKTDAAA